MKTPERIVLWLVVISLVGVISWQQVAFKERLSVLSYSISAYRATMEQVEAVQLQAREEHERFRRAFDENNQITRAMLDALSRGAETTRRLTQQNRQVLESIVDVQADEAGVVVSPKGSHDGAVSIRK